MWAAAASTECSAGALYALPFHWTHNKRVLGVWSDLNRLLFGLQGSCYGGWSSGSSCMCLRLTRRTPGSTPARSFLPRLLSATAAVRPRTLRTAAVSLAAHSKTWGTSVPPEGVLDSGDGSLIAPHLRQDAPYLQGPSECKSPGLPRRSTSYY